MALTSMTAADALQEFAHTVERAHLDAPWTESPGGPLSVARERDRAAPDARGGAGHTRTNRPVLTDNLYRLPVSLDLIALSMLLSLAIALPAGIIAALRPNSWKDYTAMMVAMAWRQLLRKKTAVLAMGIVGVLVLTAIFAGLLAPYGPTTILSQEAMSPPTWTHPMGTDLLGRDVLSRVTYGSRVSIYVGVFSLVLAFLLGIPLGTVAGVLWREPR